MAIIDPTQADVIREKHRERTISSRSGMRWKENVTGYEAKAKWYVRGSKDLDIHVIELSCPKSELSPTNITLHLHASDYFRRDVA